MRSIGQIHSEIYQIILGQDLTPMQNIIIRKYPKSKGKLSKLNNDQMETIIPLIKEKYNVRTQVP